jgi:hypothetical protein
MAVLRAHWPGRIDGRIVLYLGFLGLMSALGLAAFGREAPPALRVTPVDPWTPIEKPFEVVALAGSDLRDVAYAADRHADGGRRDTLSARLPGGFSARVSLRRLGPGGAPPSETDALRTIRDRRSELSRETGRGGRLPSKFGLVETLDIVARPGEGARRCLLFARADMASRVIIAGEICREGVKAFDARHAACLADRLTLIASGRDDTLARLFQMAELRREPCAARAGDIAEARDPAPRAVGLRPRIPG